MISVWWLLLLPVVFSFGFFAAGLLAASACADCRDAIRYRENVLLSQHKQYGNDKYVEGYHNGYADGHTVGFSDGLKQLQGIG